MDNRFQHLLLTAKAALLCSAMTCASLSYGDSLDIDNEVFELGIFAGVLNIEDFNSEFAPGIRATFRASEDYFIQYNYLEAEASLSSYEKSQGKLFDGDDRTFSHYDLLVGYNVFQGEFFPGSTARLSTLYVVGGVGETSFGGESGLAYTMGVGYQVAITRRFAVQFDFRDYISKSSLISDESRSVHTTQISSGISYLF